LQTLLAPFRWFSANQYLPGGSNPSPNYDSAANIEVSPADGQAAHYYKTNDFTGAPVGGTGGVLINNFYEVFTEKGYESVDGSRLLGRIKPDTNFNDIFDSVELEFNTTGSNPDQIVDVGHITFMTGPLGTPLYNGLSDMKTVPIAAGGDMPTGNYLDVMRIHSWKGNGSAEVDKGNPATDFDSIVRPDTAGILDIALPYSAFNLLGTDADTTITGGAPTKWRIRPGVNPTLVEKDNSNGSLYRVYFGDTSSSASGPGIYIWF
jgi:hypothetical protein